jgi:hypothetical protein
MGSNHTEVFMKQSGRIVGEVEFRPGDGAKMLIPQGPVEIETSETDATLSWVDEDTHGAAALPMAEFKRYVAEGAIALADQP